LAYTILEAVRASGIGRTKLYELIREGRLEARKVGTRTLIPADGLRALLQSLPPVHLPSLDSGTGQVPAAGTAISAERGAHGAPRSRAPR
jgi:excisionase family DNA binding protein